MPPVNNNGSDVFLPFLPFRLPVLAAPVYNQTSEDRDRVKQEEIDSIT
jgi:hypothetical protein